MVTVQNKQHFHNIILIKQKLLNKKSYYLKNIKYNFFFFYTNIIK